MAEQDPPRLADMMTTSAWWPDLTEDQRQRVLAEVEERRYTGGSVVMRKGEMVEAWTGVIEGLIKINVVSQTGKSATFTGIGPGGWFGEGSLLKNEPRRYDVMALRRTRVALMNRGTFLWLMDHSIPFNRYLITQLNKRLGQFIGMMENERLLDPDARVARCLAGLFNPALYPGTNRLLQISQEELGYLAGVSRQRANQALRTLEDAGLVRSEYGGIDILDLDGLSRFGE